MKNPKIRNSIIFLFAVLIPLSFPVSGFGQTGLEMSYLSESRAFRQFENRPVSELSKLLYLLDRLNEVRIEEIIYEGRGYPPRMVSGLGRWYLSRHYNEEPAEMWLSKWCYRTHRSGEPVWVRLAGGDRIKASDILREELDLLSDVSPRL